MSAKKEQLLKRIEKEAGKEVWEVIGNAWKQFWKLFRSGDPKIKAIKEDLLHLYDVVEQALDHYQEVEIDPPAELIVALSMHDCDRFYPGAPELKDFPNRNAYKQAHAWVSAQKARQILLQSELEPILISRVLGRIVVHHANWEYDQLQQVFSMIDERSFWRVYLESYFERLGKDRTLEQVKDKMMSKYIDLSDEDKEWVREQVEKIDNPVLQRLFKELVQEFPEQDI